MSVIAKLMVRAAHDFGTGRLYELGCVCDNDLMAAYAESEEDKLFTKYSPWGEMKLHQPSGWALVDYGWGPGEIGPQPAFYVMALHESEHELVDEPEQGYLPSANFPGAAVWAFGTCRSITDFGGDSRQVLFEAGNRGTVKGRGFEALTWKMSIDNPAASNQFKAGQRYFFALYDATKFDRNAAIAAAHGGAG
jgi:hypothetical protein